MSVREWITTICAIIGTAFGIYNFVIARRKEAREEREESREERDRRQQEEDKKMYVAVRAAMERAGGNALQADVGSALYWWAERMVKEGLLERGPSGHFYTLPRGSSMKSPYN